jgi:hypothetical protein
MSSLEQKKERRGGKARGGEGGERMNSALISLYINLYPNLLQLSSYQISETRKKKEIMGMTFKLEILIETDN